MTTLGALLVGLLLLLLLLGVFAWLQRRPRRGPEQPRTVADLVRMREATRPHSDDAGPAAGAPSEAAELTDDEPEPVEGGPVAAGGSSEVAPVARKAPRDPRPDEPVAVGAAAPVVVSAPEAATVDMPWARAARMVEPWGATASDEPASPTADAAPVADQPRPSLTLLSSDKVDGRSRRASYWATRTKSSHHPSTTVAKPVAFEASPQTAASQADSPAKPAPHLDSSVTPAGPAEVVGPLLGRTRSPVEPAGSPAEPVDARAAAAVIVPPPTEPVDARAAILDPSTEAAYSQAQAADPGVESVDSPAVPATIVDPRTEPADSQAEPGDLPAAIVDPPADAAGSPDDSPAAIVGPPAETAGSGTVPVDPPAASAAIVDPQADAAGTLAEPVDPPTTRADDPLVERAAEPVDSRARAAGLPVMPADPPTDDVGALVEPAAAPVDARVGDSPEPADPRPRAVAQPAESAEAPFVAARTTAALSPAPTPANVVASADAATELADAPRVDDTPAQPTNGHGPLPTPARVAGRVRRRPSATPAEQAAADLALLRTFGVAGRNGTADEPEVELEGCTPDDGQPVAGEAQPIAFRVLARDGRGIHGATVTLVDDHGRETASTRTRSDGHDVLIARHPGGYMLVAAADGFQPGAITVAVTDAPVDAEIPLTRSASIVGSVGGEDGPIVGARLALVQDGEIVDTTESAKDGAYRFADLAAGEYGLSVTAYDCEAVAFVLELADEADLRRDVDLVPAGLPADDVMTARR